MLDINSQVFNQNRQIRTIKVRECEPCMGGDPVHGRGARSAQSVQPGLQGEILPFSSSTELSGGNLRLEVTYNPGTGWLYDKNLKKVSSRGSSCLNT